MSTISELKLLSGRKIPTIGSGLMLFKTPEADDVEMTYRSIKAGFRLLDTAQAYGNEEKVVAGMVKWIQESPEHRREDLIYTTKIYDQSYDYKSAKKAIEVSIERAKDIGYIDIILNHCPQTSSKKRHGVWQALQEAVESGKVKQIGVSNFGLAHMKELLNYPDLRIKPVINQLELHPWMSRTELTDFLKENGIVAEAYSPLTRGVKFSDPDIVAFAKKYNKSAAQILLRWSIQRGYVPLPRTHRFERIPQNIDVFDFKLTKEEMGTLNDKDEYLFLAWDPTTYPLEQ